MAGGRREMEGSGRRESVMSRDEMDGRKTPTELSQGSLQPPVVAKCVRVCACVQYLRMDIVQKGEKILFRVTCPAALFD